MICPGCRVDVPDISGNPQRYIGAAAGCWQVYGQVLAKQYSEYRYPQPTHRLTVDTYAVQHPGVPGRQSAQSVNVHLVGLYLILENKLQGMVATNALRGMLENALGFDWLEPPKQIGTITIHDVVKAKDLDEHKAIVHKWSGEVWQAWAPHHEHIAKLVGKFLR